MKKPVFVATLALGLSILGGTASAQAVRTEKNISLDRKSVV